VRCREKALINDGSSSSSSDLLDGSYLSHCSSKPLLQLRQLPLFIVPAVWRVNPSISCTHNELRPASVNITRGRRWHPGDTPSHPCTRQIILPPHPPALWSFVLGDVAASSNGKGLRLFAFQLICIQRTHTTNAAATVAKEWSCLISTDTGNSTDSPDCPI